MTEQINSGKDQKKKLPLIASLVVVGFLSLVLGWGVSKFQENSRNSEKIALKDTTLNDFLNTDWKTPEGELINTTSWQGKTLVINFWGSWCPPCVEEMPMLGKTSTELKSQNVLFIGIGIDSPSNIREFLLKTPAPYPVAIGGLEGSSWAKRLGNETGGLPFTAIVSPNGELIYKKLGKIEENELKSAIFKKK